MKKSYAKGFSFGIMSAVITTLGLMIGLSAATASKLAVVGGVISIAIADALSDAVGVHALVESEGAQGREVWEAASTTFLSKFIFALVFLIPVIFLNLQDALWTAIGIGVVLIVIISYKIAKLRNESFMYQTAEHLVLTFIVLAVTHYVGMWVASVF